MAATKFTQQQIVKKFVYLDLPEEGYNNQDFYQMSDETLRYVLVTCELPFGRKIDGRELKEGQEENKFYNCIEFNTYTESPTVEKFKVNNPKLLQELMDMDYDSLYNYVEDNEFEWLGGDFEHIEEYLNFVSYMQDEVEFIAGGTHNDDEYMDIIKLYVDKRKNSKYETAIQMLMSYAPTGEYTRNDILRKLQGLGIDTDFLDKQEGK